MAGTQNSIDLYYPTVLVGNQQLDPTATANAIRRAYDLIYLISPPDDTGLPSSVISAGFIDAFTIKFGASQVTLQGEVFTASTNGVSWNAHELFYKSVQYNILAGSSTLKYIYWQLLAPNHYQSSATYPNLGPDDWIIALWDQGGTNQVYELWNTQFAPQFISTALIEDASITTAKIQDLAVSTAKIDDLAVTTAKIQDLAVTDAKIQSLSATKITTGTLAASVSITLTNSDTVPAVLIWGNTGESYADVTGGSFGAMYISPLVTNTKIINIGTATAGWLGINLYSTSSIHLQTQNGTSIPFNSLIVDDTATIIHSDYYGNQLGTDNNTGIGQPYLLGLAGNTLGWDLGQSGAGGFRYGYFTNDVQIHGVPYAWPTSNSAGLLTNDGAGNLSWASGGGGFGTSEPKFAHLYSGGDLGAKISAASADIGTGVTPGEIWVLGDAAGTVISTPAVWGYCQTVRFFGGGVYLVNGTGYLSGGYLLGVAYGSDIAPVQFVQDNAANLPYMWQGVAVKGSVQDVTFDGNQANNPTAGDNIQSQFRQMFVRVKSLNSNRHGFYLTAYNLNAGGGNTFVDCSSYGNNGSGVRAEGCADLCTRGYTEVGGNLLHGMDLFNCPGARLIGGDFASNQLSGLNINGTTVTSGGLNDGLVTIIGNQFGQNYEQDITIQGYDAVNAGSIGFDITITGNVFWCGSNRTGSYPSIDLYDCSDITIANNVFDSTLGGSEYRNAVRENTTGFAGANVIGPNNCTTPFAGVTYDLIPGLSVVHAGTGDGGISTYTELDVVNLGISGGTFYLGGNYLTTGVTQFINNSVLGAGGITGSLYIAALSGTSVAYAVDTSGNFGVAGTFGIAGAATSDPAIGGRVWANSGVMTISGYANTPTFAGIGCPGTLYFGAYGTSSVPEIIPAFTGYVSNVEGSLFAFANSGVAAYVTMDAVGNMGIAGTISCAGFPSSDPGLTGWCWGGPGGMIVASGFDPNACRSGIGAATTTGIGSGIVTLAQLTPTGAPGYITWSPDGCITSYGAPS